MVVVETERLTIRHFHPGDAPYIVRQLNDPAFIQCVGNKGVTTVAEAHQYLATGPSASYTKYGYGLNALILTSQQICIGMCGLVQRPDLPFPDLGVALLPGFRRCGYMAEAARAVLHNAYSCHRCVAILGLTRPDNHAANPLLCQLGFVLLGTWRLQGVGNHVYFHRQPNVGE